MFPTRNLAKFQKIQRGLYNEKEQRFIVDPPKLPKTEKMIKGHWITNNCHVVICGVPCENCFKKLQNCPKRPVQEDVPWEVKIQPVKATKTEEEKGDDEGHDARPRRNRKKPKKPAKRNRSLSIVIVSPEKDQTKAKDQVQKAATLVVDMSNGEKKSSPEREPNENDFAPKRKKVRRSKSFVKENQDFPKIPIDSMEETETHDQSIIKELENQNLIEITNKSPNDENKPLNVALAEETITANKPIGNVKLFVNSIFILYARWHFKLVCLQPKLASLVNAQKI